jgi:hypothetical protein
MDRVNPESLRFILESAIQAPSADNQHRICFDLTETAIRVRYTNAELPPQGGYRRVLALLSLGAVSENLTVAASRFGVRAETVLFPDPAQPDWIMQICLHPGQAEVDSLWQAISQRHTNRRVRFRGPNMTDAECGELGAAAQAYPSCQLIWLNDPPQRNQALCLMRRAETERFRTRQLHEELFSAIRFDEGWQMSSAEGLPPGALGVELLLRPFFALLRHWPVMQAANLLGMHQFMGWRACELPCRLAPHLGLLAVKNPDTQTVFDTGRAFQRLWLEVTRQGRVLQPMPASALFALPGAQSEGVSANTQRALEKAWKTSLDGAIPLMLFRIGFAKPLPVVAGRRKLEGYLPQQLGGI